MAAIYVGTYAKYNSGSIEGAWVDLDEHDTEESFFSACQELHADEVDPEFMFQDADGIPKAYYSESYLDSRLWEWLQLNDDDKQILSAYMALTWNEATIEEAKEHYYGRYDSEEEFAQEYADEHILPHADGMVEELSRYFDYKAYARDLFLDSFMFHDGIVFYN